jgi:hypothetical protein
MVYCGKASQGCQNCRTRRIKVCFARFDFVLPNMVSAECDIVACPEGRGLGFSHGRSFRSDLQHCLSYGLPLASLSKTNCRIYTIPHPLAILRESTGLIRTRFLTSLIRATSCRARRDGPLVPSFCLALLPTPSCPCALVHDLSVLVR